MSDTVQVALVASIVPTLGILLKFWQDNKEYRRSLNADNTANTKLDHITVLTNSTLTAANTEIKALKLQVQELLEVIKKEHNDKQPPNKE